MPKGRRFTILKSKGKISLYNRT